MDLAFKDVVGELDTFEIGFERGGAGIDVFAVYELGPVAAGVDEGSGGGGAEFFGDFDKVEAVGLGGGGEDVVFGSCVEAGEEEGDEGDFGEVVADVLGLDGEVPRGPVEGAEEVFVGVRAG